jgi:hypothetical protein
MKGEPKSKEEKLEALGKEFIDLTKCQGISVCVCTGTQDTPLYTNGSTLSLHDIG